MEISVVIPEYGCREAVQELYRRLSDVLSALVQEYEIIFVEDRDPQNSWEDIRPLTEKDPHVKGIHFTRNFGQERAITAGLQYSTGNYVVVMDCDLQDRPEGIKELYELALKGNDVVYVRRAERKDSAVTKFLSGMFYKVYNLLADDDYDPLIGNFSIASRRAVNSVLAMNETNRGYIMFLKWLGYPSATIDIIADERAAGKSSYNLIKKIRYAIQEITSQSNKPLWAAVYLGGFIAFVAFLVIVVLVVRHFIDGTIPEGWISIMVGIYFMGGIVLSCLGIHGIYLGNVYNEVRSRPLYVIDEMKNLCETDSNGTEE
ncbi:MAG: glycosyltransferase family 2 protein [Solobacterium sp.]|nr:glycosyltransferase family 2 protein [Solobacterium sp.]